MLSGCVDRPVHVGDTVRGRVVLPTAQFTAPNRKTVTWSGHPVDMVLTSGQTLAYIKDESDVVCIDLRSFTVAGKFPIKGGASLTGIALTSDNGTLLVTNANRSLFVMKVDGPKLIKQDEIQFPSPSVGGSPYPCGVAVDDRPQLAFVCLNRSNQLATVDLKNLKVTRTIDTDIAPFSCALDVTRSQVLVTSWSRRPEAGQPVADASGTPAPVDERGIGLGGSIVAYDETSGRMVAHADLGSQPTEIALDASFAYVAVPNDDSVDQIDLESLQIKRRFSISDGGFGNAPSSIAVGTGEVVATCGGANALIDFPVNKAARRFATEWYPISVRSFTSGWLYLCGKGTGSRGGKDPHKHSDYDFTCSLSIAPPVTAWKPSHETWVGNPASEVSAQDLRRMFKHVVYVIKENRTYDQIFGDFGKGEGAPDLAVFGAKVTPNHHALAARFGLLDNFYCNGVLSADGHAWATEGNASTYYEHTFGGWTRSYPFGDDPLATTKTGYLWDDAMDHAKSVLNFGEFDYATPDPDSSWKQVYEDFISGHPKLRFKHNIGVKRLAAVSDPLYPGWNLSIPDVLRADRFAKVLHEHEKTGQWPALTVLYFPQDHTSGGNGGSPTPRAYVADNDLGLGRAIDALSHSRFWKDTCVFVVEDDSQDGFDHVDGHRSPCIVASAYCRRGAVISDFYIQTSVLKTIETILGLPPMTRFDRNAPLMTACFQKAPNPTPYTALPNRIPLDEMNSGNSHDLALSKPDEADEDQMNHEIWALCKGAGVPYPGD